MRRVGLRRVLALVVLALVLYGVAPALASVFSAWPRLRDIQPAWFVVMIVAQAGSLWCLCKLQALCMGIPRARVVIASSLVSGALGRALPGGTATAAATQYEMLRHAGVPGPAIGLGLAAGTLLQLAGLCALPLLAAPAVALGLSVPATLATGAAISAGVFAGILGVTALLVLSDRSVCAAGRLIDAIRCRLRRGGTAPGGLPARLLAERDQIVRVLGRRWKLALAVTAGRWLFDFFTLGAALIAVGAHTEPALTLVAYGIAQLLGQLPLTPGGVGIVEAGLTGTLSLAGASGGAAAIATLAYRIVSYWLVMLAGLVAWLVHQHQRHAAPAPSGGAA
jgi:uncharacterized membrane protein YbhN (UPF0104 family)